MVLPLSVDTSKQQASSPQPIDPHENGDHAVNSEGHASDGGEHKVERYPITTVDFGRVETPFIIGIWILFASIAKIGK